jgi:hypothetical protein
MTAEALLQELQRCQVTLHPEGSELRCRAPKGAMTDALRQAIRAHKAALLRLLTQDTSPAPRAAQAPTADVEERAAIYEYEGGMTRHAAELLAAHGYVVGLPACVRCNGMAYKYEDGHVRCTTPWCQADAGAEAID